VIIVLLLSLSWTAFVLLLRIRAFSVMRDGRHLELLGKGE
jgi:hypothetical protein